MAISTRPPNTVYLGGPRTEVNDLVASEAITPGMLVERVSSSGLKWQKHATAAGVCHAFATEASMQNADIDTNYAAADLVEVSIGVPGSTFYALIASGANIAVADKLESAGTGKLRAYTSGVAPFVALEAVNNSAGPGDARIRVEVL